MLQNPRTGAHLVLLHPHGVRVHVLGCGAAAVGLYYCYGSVGMIVSPWTHFSLALE